MTFVAIERDQAAAVYANDLVQIVNLLNEVYARIERTEERMQEMNAAQIETLYGVPDGLSNAVKTQIVDALAAFETEDGALEKLRTQLG